jgi:hypothetical protein
MIKEPGGEYQKTVKKAKDNELPAGPLFRS